VELRDKDALIKLWGQKVKGQGHDDAVYGQKNTCSEMCLYGEGMPVDGPASKTIQLLDLDQVSVWCVRWSKLAVVWLPPAPEHGSNSVLSRTAAADLKSGPTAGRAAFKTSIDYGYSITRLDDKIWKGRVVLDVIARIPRGGRAYDLKPYEVSDFNAPNKTPVAVIRV